MRPLKPCGSPAAYRRHLRHGERACLQCRAAHAERIRSTDAYKAARREARRRHQERMDEWAQRYGWAAS